MEISQWVGSGPQTSYFDPEIPPSKINYPTHVQISDGSPVVLKYISHYFPKFSGLQSITLSSQWKKLLSLHVTSPTNQLILICLKIEASREIGRKPKPGTNKYSFTHAHMQTHANICIYVHTLIHTCAHS